jgi:hypothetical protein
LAHPSGLEVSTIYLSNRLCLDRLRQQHRSNPFHQAPLQEKRLGNTSALPVDMGKKTIDYHQKIIGQRNRLNTDSQNCQCAKLHPHDVLHSLNRIIVIAAKHKSIMNCSVLTSTPAAPPEDRAPSAAATLKLSSHWPGPTTLSSA